MPDETRACQSSSAILSVFFGWQIICYLCGVRFYKIMLISLIVGLVLALIFGKITVKEIKNYVRKHTEGFGTGSSGNSGNSGTGKGGEEGKEDIPEEGEEVKD
jgi:hypothetical protein